MKPKVLWIGDAVVATGFERCTRNILDVVKETWEVHVLGLNHTGDPYDRTKMPYDIYPAHLGGDPFGLPRVANLVSRIKPDLVVVQNDPWNVPAYVQRIGNVPTIGFLAVDGKNVQGTQLHGLARAVFWTEFARQEANQGGYTGKSAVVPLGVDLDTYFPMNDKAGIIKKFGLPDRLIDGFIVGNVNRNQPRKRLDLMVSYFAQWVKDYKIPDAYLYFHEAPTADAGYDISQLMQYYGLSNRIICSNPPVRTGISEAGLRHTYNVFDIQATTTQGEGWGLPHMEGMACGVPQLVPDWSALGEWPEDTVYKVPCTQIAVTPQEINIIGGIADRWKYIEGLNNLYVQSDLRKELGEKGRQLVNRDHFRWPAIGAAFLKIMDEVHGSYELQMEKEGRQEVTV